MPEVANPTVSEAAAELARVDVVTAEGESVRLFEVAIDAHVPPTKGKGMTGAAR